MAGMVAIGGHIAMTGLAVKASSSVSWMVAATTLVAAADDTIEEPEVVVGHHGLGGPRQVSIPKVVDTTLSALQHVWDVLLQERRGLDEEQKCLVEW
jgi:hypothetical protein